MHTQNECVLRCFASFLLRFSLSESLNSCVFPCNYCSNSHKSNAKCVCQLNVCRIHTHTIQCLNRALSNFIEHSQFFLHCLKKHTTNFGLFGADTRMKQFNWCERDETMHTLSNAAFMNLPLALRQHVQTTNLNSNFNVFVRTKT